MSERNNQSNIELLVFDWDGTLADSLQQITSAIQKSIHALNLEKREDNTVRGIIGLGLQEAIMTLYPELDERGTIALIERYRHYYLSAMNGSVNLYPHAEATIKQLYEEGYYLAIATGKSRRGLDRALQESGLENYFHVTRCADETFSKPHPQMLQYLIDFLGVSPERSVMIGDSEHDMQMAANAGVAAIAVNYGAQDANQLLKYNPVTSVDNLQELTAWLAQQNSSRTDN